MMVCRIQGMFYFPMDQLSLPGIISYDHPEGGANRVPLVQAVDKE